MLNKSNLKGPGGKLGAKYYLRRQSWPGYFRQTVDLCEIAPYRKIPISIFQEFFASVDKILILEAGLSARLQFYEVLRSS